MVSRTATASARMAAANDRHAAAALPCRAAKALLSPSQTTPGSVRSQAGAAPDRPARQCVGSRPPVRVILPDEPPRLTPAAARALLRILVRAADHDRRENP